MDILYSSSDSYAFLTGISLLSLLENNKACKEINIYIMDNAITEINRNKLKSVAEQYNRSISFVPMPDMKKMTGLDIDTRRWNISTFGRLYMASALQESVHKVLNIDCDTIIVDSIEPLWNTDLTGKIFGGMLECINDRYRRNLGMKPGEPYLNGGIVLLNLDEVRKKNYETKFTNYIKKYGDSLAYLDQDVLNGTIPARMKVTLPMRYNVLSIYCYANYEQTMRIRRANSFYNKDEYKKAVQNPGLIHFTTCFLDGLRPWIEGNRHPYLKTFLAYKNKSPWRDMPLLTDKRSSTEKMKSRIIKKIPRVVICEIASIMHGILVPIQNRRKMNASVKQRKKNAEDKVKVVLAIKNNRFVRFVMKPIENARRKKRLKIYGNSEDSKKVATLKDRFVGEECFIIGNGPSLKIADLEHLEGKYTFGANRIYTLYNKTSWRPTFYTCVDPEAYKLFGDKLNDMEADFLFYDILARNYMSSQISDKTYFIYQYAPFTNNRWDSTHPFVSEDASKMVSMGMTVTFIAIQLAIYMGFKRIYLVGVDHNYAKQVRRDGKVIEDPTQKSYGEGIVDSGIGVQYTDTTTEAYQQAQKYCETHDVKIFNATRGGKLEVFPRVDLDVLLNIK